MPQLQPPKNFFKYALYVVGLFFRFSVPVFVLLGVIELATINMLMLYDVELLLTPLLWRSAFAIDLILAFTYGLYKVEKSV